MNKGKGAALKNAFRYFLANRPDGFGVVTVDGDNQHHPADTRACCEHMLQTGHAVLPGEHGRILRLFSFRQSGESFADFFQQLGQ